MTEESKQLTWRDGQIPENEIRIKVGSEALERVRKPMLDYFATVSEKV